MILNVEQYFFHIYISSPLDHMAVEEQRNTFVCACVCVVEYCLGMNNDDVGEYELRMNIGRCK